MLCDECLLWSGIDKDLCLTMCCWSASYYRRGLEKCVSVCTNGQGFSIYGIFLRIWLFFRFAVWVLTGCRLVRRLKCGASVRKQLKHLPILRSGICYYDVSHHSICIVLIRTSSKGGLHFCFFALISIVLCVVVISWIERIGTIMWSAGVLGLVSWVNRLLSFVSSSFRSAVRRNLG